MIIKLIQTSTRDFISALWMMSYQAQTLGEQFHKVRQLYEIHEIENKIPDGTEAFPGDGQSLMSGFSIEFQYVLFFPVPRFPDDRLFVNSEMFPSATLAPKSLRSATYRSRSRRGNSASVKLEAFRPGADS